MPQHEVTADPATGAARFGGPEPLASEGDLRGALYPLAAPRDGGSPFLFFGSPSPVDAAQLDSASRQAMRGALEQGIPASRFDAVAPLGPTYWDDLAWTWERLSQADAAALGVSAAVATPAERLRDFAANGLYLPGAPALPAGWALSPWPPRPAVPLTGCLPACRHRARS